jgi:hypothetical protein
MKARKPMSRKTFNLNMDILPLDELCSQGRHYITGKDGDYADLLIEEIRMIEVAARMTPREAIVFEWHMRGLNNVQIAQKMHRDESTIRQTLRRAFRKWDSIPDKGAFTSVAESQGAKTAREYFSGIVPDPPKNILHARIGE